MCYADKFFFCVPLDLGCLILGCITFILSIALGTCSIYLMVLENYHHEQGVHHLKSFKALELNIETIDFILATVTLLAVLWMVASVILVAGIRKNKSSFVLLYFTFGTIMTIVGMLSALLVLLSSHWLLPLALFTVSLLYIHCLVVVHTCYDLMLRGTTFKFSQRRHSDEAILVEPDNRI